MNNEDKEEENFNGTLYLNVPNAFVIHKSKSVRD